MGAEKMTYLYYAVEVNQIVQMSKDYGEWTTLPRSAFDIEAERAGSREAVCLYRIGKI